MGAAFFLFFFSFVVPVSPSQFSLHTHEDATPSEEAYAKEDQVQRKEEQEEARVRRPGDQKAMGQGQIAAPKLSQSRVRFNLLQEIMTTAQPPYSPLPAD